MTQAESSTTQQPKLMTLSDDGRPLKPEELENKPIVILDSINHVAEDGRDTAQWVVRAPDGETRLYWAAGRGAMVAVRQWFRENPRRPLYAAIWRTQTANGYNLWHIEQREPDESLVPMQPKAGDGKAADGADEIPF